MQRKNPQPICPITGQHLTYSGRGRPPVFAKTVSHADRKAYWDSLGRKHMGRTKRA